MLALSHSFRLVEPHVIGNLMKEQGRLIFWHFACRDQNLGPQIWVYVCMCLSERKEKSACVCEREYDKERATERESAHERERVCAYEGERKRKRAFARERECVYQRESERVYHTESFL